MINNNPFSLSGKTILVTGASSGLGISIGIETSRMGAKVVITGRNKDRLNETYKQLAGEGNKLIIADLLNDDDLNSLVNDVPKLNGIVLNAGVSKVIPVKSISTKHIDKVFQTNLLSSIKLIQKLLRMGKILNGGSIVFISSISSSRATIGNSLYASSKGGINSFAKVLALELISKQITVNCIEPGFIRTPMIEDGLMTEEKLEEHYKQFPLRKGVPTDISYACVYLLSDAASWITGSVFIIDGGYSLK